MALRVQQEDVGCISIYLLVGTAEYRIFGTGHIMLYAQRGRRLDSRSGSRLYWGSSWFR